jgi:hypothetical protein
MDGRVSNRGDLSQVVTPYRIVLARSVSDPDALSLVDHRLVSTLHKLVG